MLNNSRFTLSIHNLPKYDPRYLKWLSSLKKRPPPWNKGENKFTNKSVKKISDTFKRKRIDNFINWRSEAQRRGIIPDSNKVFERNQNLAFLIGLVLGDGYIGAISRCECLTITLGTDKPRLWKYAARIVANVFSKDPSVKKRKSSNCVDIKIYQKNISKRLGIPLGARKTKKIVTPVWITKNKNFLLHFLKGLFEAEASFSIHKPTYTYNFAFSNNNISLLNSVENALVKMGYNPERRSNAVRLRRKTEALSFKKLIWFRKYN